MYTWVCRLPHLAWCCLLASRRFYAHAAGRDRAALASLGVKLLVGFLLQIDATDNFMEFGDRLIAWAVIRKRWGRGPQAQRNGHRGPRGRPYPQNDRSPTLKKFLISSQSAATW